MHPATLQALRLRLQRTRKLLKTPTPRRRRAGR